MIFQFLRMNSFKIYLFSFDHIRSHLCLTHNLLRVTQLPTLSLSSPLPLPKQNSFAICIIQINRRIYWHVEAPWKVFSTKLAMGVYSSRKINLTSSYGEFLFKKVFLYTNCRHLNASATHRSYVIVRTSIRETWYCVWKYPSVSFT